MKSSGDQAQANSVGIAGSWIGEVFDASPLGILQVDLSGRVMYLNEKGLSIWGLKGWEGKTVRDLFSDEATYGHIQAHMAKRRQGKSEEYEVEITRASDKEKEYQSRLLDGRSLPWKKGIVGAISIIRSMETEKVVQGFNWFIAEARTTAQLLQGVAEETRKILSVDLFVVSKYSQNMRFARVLFASPEGILSASRRWYRISDKMFAWTQKPDRIKSSRPRFPISLSKRVLFYPSSMLDWWS